MDGGEEGDPWDSPLLLFFRQQTVSVMKDEPSSSSFDQERKSLSTYTVGHSLSFLLTQDLLRHRKGGGEGRTSPSQDLETVEIRETQERKKKTSHFPFLFSLSLSFAQLRGWFERSHVEKLGGGKDVMSRPFKEGHRLP